MNQKMFFVFMFVVCSSVLRANDDVCTSQINEEQIQNILYTQKK